MKYLFLDIDGVLNSENWYGWRQYCYNNKWMDKIQDPSITDEFVQYKLHEIDERAVANLNRIIDKTGCKVVLSSSWRSSSDFENTLTNYVLTLKGFKYTFYGVTPRLFSQDRGVEIKRWLEEESKKNEIESYLILDDDCDMLPDQMDNFILVNRQYGLSDIDVFKAIEILNK